MSELTQLPLPMELPQPPEGCYIVFHSGMTPGEKERAGKKSINDYFWDPANGVWEHVWSVKPNFAEGVIYARKRL
jgi:hypothetical protein